MKALLVLWHALRLLTARSPTAKAYHAYKLARALGRRLKNKNSFFTSA